MHNAGVAHRDRGGQSRLLFLQHKEKYFPMCVQMLQLTTHMRTYVVLNVLVGTVSQKKVHQVNFIQPACND